VKRSIKILFHSGIVTLTSPSKFLTGTIFLHVHQQAVYYNCVKFHLNPMSRLGGVALTSPSLHTERISEHKLNHPPFQIWDSTHIPLGYRILLGGAFLYPPQTKYGGYVGITLSIRPSVCPFVHPSVRPSMYLVSATPPKRLIGFL
jgi:hypothetical protein